MDWELYAWVKRGSQRKNVLQTLGHASTPLSTSDLKSKLKVAMAQASFTVKELTQKKLIESVNPKDKIGKLYKITNKGKAILNEI